MSAAAQPCYRMIGWRILYRGVSSTAHRTAGAAIQENSSCSGGGGGERDGALMLMRSASSSSSSSAGTTRLRASTQPCANPKTWTTVRPQERRRGVCTEAAGDTSYGQTVSGGERVTSTDNATVKHMAKLVKDRGYREESGSIVVAGAGLLEEIYGGNSSLGDAKVLFLSDDAAAPPNGVNARRTVHAPEHVMKKAAGLQSVDRVDAVAELAMPPLAGVGALKGAGKMTRLLALDGIQDPGNLGTLVRTALALGWDAVALLPGTCDPYNDKALRAARGGVFRLPMARLSWAELEEVTTAHKLSRFCAEPTAPDAVDATATRGWVGEGGEGGEGGGGGDGETGSGRDVDNGGAGAGGGAADHSNSEGLCLVLGSEGQGLSQAALDSCQPVSIPMPGEMESLNVGIAGGILMYLMRR